MSTFLFDIGGTNMRMAIGKNGLVTDVQKIPTPALPEETVAALATYAQEHGESFERASGGIAGDIRDGIVHSSAHLSQWHAFPFAAALTDMLSVPVTIKNDAEQAGLGEAIYGAGKSHQIVAYIGIGTGVGGSLVVNGRTAPHAGRFEPGHHVIDISTGTTFERVVSGSALESHFGTPPPDLAPEIYANLTPILAVGLYNVLLHWSPDVLVLGGSLMNEENGYRIPDIEAALMRIPRSMLSVLPIIVHSVLGDASGLYGALSVS